MRNFKLGPRVFTGADGKSVYIDAEGKRYACVEIADPQGAPIDFDEPPGDADLIRGAILRAEQKLKAITDKTPYGTGRSVGEFVTTAIAIVREEIDSALSERKS